MNPSTRIAKKLRAKLPLSRRVLERMRRSGSRRDSEARLKASGSPTWDLASRSLGPDLLRGTKATDRLYGRLGEAELAAIQSRLDPDQVSAVASATGADRKRLMLAFGVYHSVSGVPEKTGLSAATPPEEVHSMGRGPLASGGTAYYADLVVDALDGTGVELGAGTRALDFGCSSGRVVRVLAAAYPEVEWHGCDPIESSIEWARANLERVEFQVSPQNPPLAYRDQCFDLVFAISIWSHFSSAAALEWFAEMRRIVRPAGALVFTTHGIQSVAHYADNGIRSREQLTKIVEALYADGHWYAPEFGERGDHGLVNPSWGTAFCSLEWLATNLCESWQIAGFASGRAEGNQDVVVLERL